MTDPAAEQVDNLYKDALNAARPGAITNAGEMRRALNAAETAMTNGAWVSPAATDFSHTLADKKRDLGTAADSVPAAFDAKAPQPEKVDKTDWRASWQTRHFDRPGGI